MPKLRKDDVEDIDVNEMEEAEYSDETFSDYDGEVPRTGTILNTYVKKVWWTRTQPKADGGGDDPMLVILAIADENEDDLEEYNGLPIWERAVLTPAAKFRWAPFLKVFGISVRDIVGKTYVAAEEDQFGAPIEKIGVWEPGSEDAWCRVVVERRMWDGEPQARVKKWLPWAEDEAEDEEPEPDDVDDDIEDEEPEDEEPEAEPEPPRRGRRAAAAPRGSQATATARTGARTATATRTGRKPAAASSSPDGARRGTASRKPASTASRTAKASTKPAARGRGRRASAADDEDEPPF